MGEGCGDEWKISKLLVIMVEHNIKFFDGSTNKLGSQDKEHPHGSDRSGH